MIEMKNMLKEYQTEKVSGLGSAFYMFKCLIYNNLLYYTETSLETLVCIHFVMFVKKT